MNALNDGITKAEQKSIDKFIKEYPTDKFFNKNTTLVGFLFSIITTLALYGVITVNMFSAKLYLGFQVYTDGIAYGLAFLAAAIFIGGVTYVCYECRDTNKKTA